MEALAPKANGPLWSTARLAAAHGKPTPATIQRRIGRSKGRPRAPLVNENAANLI